MTFIQPQFLYLVAAAPTLAVVMLLAIWGRRRAVVRFYGAGPRRSWVPLPSLTRGMSAVLCWSMAVACIALALARPAHSPVPRKVERSGRDVVFVIDVSRSMLAQDLKPSRLDRAKLMVGDVLDSAEGDRVGLVAFAGTAVVRCPMTTDYSFARMSLEAISTDSVGRGGTAIGDAVRTSLALLTAGQQDQALAADIYLLTDGEDHETRPLEAAREAAQQGVRLITIGLGSDGGAPVPAEVASGASTGRGTPRDGYMQFGGERVQSRMNPTVLREMADATPGGVFLNVGTGNLELDRVYRLLRRDGGNKRLEATESVRYTEVFQLPLAAAIVFGIMAMLIEGWTVRWSILPRRGLGAATAVLVLASFALPVRAQSLDDDLRDGMKLLESGKPGEAISLLEGAAVRHPQSAAVALGRGCAQLAAGQSAAAESSFRLAEQLTTGGDESIAARARFNLGLIEAARAGSLAEKDARGAIKSLEQAERWFRNARPGLSAAERSAAASHIESIQRAREALRRKVEQEESQQNPQQQSQSQSGASGAGQKGDGKSGKSDQQSGPQEDSAQNSQKQGESPEQKSAQDLAELARRQEEAARDSQSAQGQDQSPQQKQEQAQKLADAQRALSEQTERLDEQLRKQQAEAKAAENAGEQKNDQSGSKPSENLARSRDKLDSARQAQARAEEQLRQGDTGAAEQSQRDAAEKLRDAARAALGIDQQQGEQQAQVQEQPQGQEQGKDGQREFNATAANILDREAKQRDAIRRFLKTQQRTRTPPVEKDW